MILGGRWYCLGEKKIFSDLKKNSFLLSHKMGCYPF